MLLPSSARSGDGVLLCVCACWLLFAGVSTSSPVKRRCHHLECADKGRHFCKAGSSHCGSCLSPLVENKEGHCVAKPKHHRHGTETIPELDQEIDFLHSVIEEQEVTVVQPKRPKVQVNTSSRNDMKMFFDVVVPKTPAASPSIANPTGSPPPPPPPLDPQGPSTPAPQPRATALVGRAGPKASPIDPTVNNILILSLISLFVVFGTVFLIVAAVCFFRLQRGSRLAKKVDYPGFKGPVTVNGTSPGDAKLQMSAQMYHYQHQKQQMMMMGKHQPEQKVADSEMTSDEEEIGGDFTVYECPGLAPTGEMEVKNPLFDDSTLQYQGNQK